MRYYVAVVEYSYKIRAEMCKGNDFKKLMEVYKPLSQVLVDKAESDLTVDIKTIQHVDSEFVISIRKIEGLTPEIIPFVEANAEYFLKGIMLDVAVDAAKECRSFVWSVNW